MRITPLDIRHKEFNRSVRGYKDTEVDEFLDEITEEFERLFNENIDAKEKLEALEDKISQYRNIEDTLQKTLISAQQQAEELKQNAQKEADLILRDAELKTRSIVNDSYAERQKIQRSIQTLKQKHEDMRYQMRKIIETYSNILDQDLDSLGEMADLDAQALGTEQRADTAAGVDEAVSRELLSEEISGPAESGTDEGADIDSGISAMALPPLKPAAGMNDEHDPFAETEADAEENRFHW